MKKLFSKLELNVFLAPIIIFIFFLPNLLMFKLPIPADALLGLYHPWRDNSYQNFNEYKFPVKNPLITDPIRQHYPWRLISVENLKEFKLPLWNPYSFSGQPLLANVQSAPLQILNVLYLLFSFNAAWTIQIISQPLLAGIFMYLFLKNRGLSYLASTFGAITLAFSGFFVAWLTWGTILAVAMWMPLILLILDKLSQKITPVSFLILTFAFFQTFVSGHTQTALYVLIAAVLYSIIKYLYKNSFKFILLIFLSILFALFLAAPQILPTLEFTTLSNRQFDQAYWPGRQDWFLPLHHLVQIIAPDFFGNPTTYNYWGIWNYGEFVTYIGIAPLILALFALIKLHKETKFFIALLFISVLLALENPISRLPYDLSIPLISSFQPSRIIFLVVFSLAVLSAYGFDYFVKQKNQKSTLTVCLFLFLTLVILMILTKIAPSIFPNLDQLNTSQIAFRNLIIPLALSAIVTLVCFSKLFNIPRKLLIVALFVITVFDLFRFAYKFTPFVEESTVFPSTKITNFLQNQDQPFRVMSTDRRIADPNTLTVYKIETVSGYDPLYLKDYSVLANTWQNDKVSGSAAFNRTINPENYNSAIANLLNVKFVLTFNELNSDRFEEILQEGQSKLYKNKGVTPRVFFPASVVKTKDSAETLSKLININADFLKESYSEDLDFSSSSLLASANIVDYSDQSLSINTASNIDAPIFISNVFYPGWKAFVDNVETPISRMNFMFQSVYVPAGEHTVELKYQPSSFYLGVYIAFFGIMATLATSLTIYATSKYQRQTDAK